MVLVAVENIKNQIREVDILAAEYAAEVVSILNEQLLEVVKYRQPDIVPVFTGDTVPGDDQSILLGILQVWGIWFQLLNIAEENTGMRRRRLLERRLGTGHVHGTFSLLLREAKENGISAKKFEQVLQEIQIRPTITAHPTEAKRVTVLEIHRRIYVLLYHLESERWVARERERFIRKLRNEIDLLWLTGELRMQKPTVEQEVSWGLHFFQQTLYERVPKVMQYLQYALKNIWPEEDIYIPAFIQFGSWIGGDRDGNPNVTNEVTQDTLFRHREHILQHYVDSLRFTMGRVSVSQHAVVLSTEFEQRLGELLQENGAAEEVSQRNPGEIFRQYIYCLLEKLQATLAENKTALAYRSADDYIKDLQTLYQGMKSCNCANLANELVLPHLQQAEAFRFRAMCLDLRENSTNVNATLRAIWQSNHPGRRVPSFTSKEWRAWLLQELERPLTELPQLDSLEGTEAKTSNLLGMIAQVISELDKEALGAFILSMTRSVNDVLAVYVLARYAGLFTNTPAGTCCRLPVVPLFETIDDLRNASAIMRELLSLVVVKRSVQGHNNMQEVMIGYSDSNKDGGFFTANWELHKIQNGLTGLGSELGITISFFHGRGGSVSRGGVQTGRAIAAQPKGTIHGQMRITEQGEVVSSKYANEGTAEYQIELLASSVLANVLHTVGKNHDNGNNDEFDAMMEKLSVAAHDCYRGLAETEGMIDYYHAASPVEELVRMNIGSRPARRFGKRTLADLRAIPWVFAWTQNRHIVPGWYGIGTALEQFSQQYGEEGDQLLQKLFDECPMFRLIIDEVEKTLALVDMQVSERYSELVADELLRKTIFTMIQEEHARSVARVLALTGEEALCVRFRRFSRKLSRRRGVLRRAGLAQVKVLHHYRSRKTKRLDDLIPLLVSINCVSTGLGWTG